ncbi:hypothetical protein ACEWY4_023191 [Coilia grayii]|uniref:Fibronectin type-III domain-containing protein n=1 Tax=Coilia grayii TaxID=363190 RepID=A0ABD1J2C4_9TELE
MEQVKGERARLQCKSKGGRMGHTTHTILILLLHQVRTTAGFNPPAIDARKIKLNISDMAKCTNLSWSRPEESVRAVCYETEVQHRSVCDEQWTSKTVRGTQKLSLCVTRTRKNYGFRVRMRYECRDEEWSAWTSEKWREDSNPDSCLPKPRSTAHYHVLWLLVAVIAGLFFCLWKQHWIRKNVFQSIPDAKNVQYNILNFSHSAWWDSQASSKGDCVIVEIEEVSPNKIRQEEKKEGEEKEEEEKEDCDDNDEKEVKQEEVEVEEKKGEEEKEEEEEDGDGDDDDDDDDDEEKPEEKEEVERMTTEEDYGDVHAHQGRSTNIICSGPYIHWGQTSKLWPSQT